MLGIGQWTFIGSSISIGMILIMENSLVYFLQTGFVCAWGHDNCTKTSKQSVMPFTIWYIAHNHFRQIYHVTYAYTNAVFSFSVNCEKAGLVAHNHLKCINSACHFDRFSCFRTQSLNSNYYTLPSTRFDYFMDLPAYVHYDEIHRNIPTL